MTSNTTALVLKSELVSTRDGLSSNQACVQDALFSLDLEGIVDLMDPNRNQFTIMELIGYRLIAFPTLDDQGTASSTQNLHLADINGLTVDTNNQMNAYEMVFMDTSVPDASQPTTVDAAANVDERWLASATNIVQDSRTALVHQPTGGAEVLLVDIQNGRNYWRDWVDLQDEKGRGFLIAAPRLIVRFSRVKDASSVGMLDDAPGDVTFQIRLRYRIKKISKNQMWQMLLQQTPGETLIRSGSAAFP